MPWKECRPVPDIRREFVETHAAGLYTVTELCGRFGVSRQTAYKWIRRFRDEGYLGRCDRRRRPHKSPTKTSQWTIDAILELRDEHPTWGARKLKDVLEKRWPNRPWPSRGTFHNILDRDGSFQESPEQTQFVLAECLRCGF